MNFLIALSVSQLPISTLVWLKIIVLIYFIKSNRWSVSGVPISLKVILIPRYVLVIS